MNPHPALSLVKERGELYEIGGRKTDMGLAVAGSNLKRTPVYSLFSALRPKLGLLDCTDTTHRGCLVFRTKFKAAMVAPFVARLRRRGCLFHSNVQLARFAGS